MEKKYFQSPALVRLSNQYYVFELITQVLLLPFLPQNREEEVKKHGSKVRK